MMNPIQETSVLVGVAPASIGAGNADGAAIDFSATYEPDARVVLQCGVLGAAATATAILQESVTGAAAWTDVTQTAVAVKATDDGLVFTASGRVAKRYVRVRVTVGAAASIVGATIIAKKRTIT